MKTLQRLAALCLCLGLVSALPAASKPKYTANEVFKKMIRAQYRQEALVCKITRTERYKLGEKKGQKLTVKGTLAVRQGGYARLEITDPAPQKLVSNSQTLWMELPEVHQVYVMSTRSMKQSGNFFLDLGGTIKFYAKNSLKRLIPPGKDFDEKTVMALELLPNDPAKSGFDVMKVWVDIKRWVILRAVLKSPAIDVAVSFDDVSVYSRAAILKNTDLRLRKHEFKYEAPEDYDLFDLDF